MTNLKVITFLDGSEWRISRYEHGYLLIIRARSSLDGLYKHYWEFVIRGSRYNKMRYEVVERSWEYGN